MVGTENLPPEEIAFDPSVETERRRGEGTVPRARAEGLQ